jgi:CopG family nickel-responsive transcriptional regulator
MLERFSTSLEQDLLIEFDRYLRERGYSNRSEAIRDLIRKSLIREEWKAGEEVVGVVTLVYNHHQRQLQDRVTELQHKYHRLVISTTHVHLDAHNCLEVVILRGDAEGVQKMAHAMMAIRGVKGGDLTMSSTGRSLH